jgi:hypothetical protein
MVKEEKKSTLKFIKKESHFLHFNFEILFDFKYYYFWDKQ